MCSSDLFSDGQIAYITAEVTNTTSIVGEEGTIEFIILDDNDNVVTSEIVEAPILFPGSYVVGGCYGTNGQVADVYYAGCPVNDFETVEIHCYLMY